MGAHWWGEAPERSRDSRDATDLFESTANKATARAESLVLGYASDEVDLLASPDDPEKLNMRWAYRGSPRVLALLITKVVCALGIANIACTFGSLAPPNEELSPHPPFRPLADTQKKRPPALQPNGRPCYHAT